ncbi:ABC transporter ATP-binding protein [Pollutimonas nitritireducens]|uniref:ABC transporter ATP-binding protein n=1 Tax=Pollutimonas nitritireducens TaxID=2045209 RepID=A0A2N4UAT5_9BURK|nr:ABC transporter ATP-binding protein [Pollutimonas nitritireducens]PLC52123.1 ABC transporter ATP-binding protein [Pollutimonas nitritireducens]
MIHGQTGEPGRALSANNIALSYDGFQVLHQVSLRVEPGQITGIVGPNGAGKSSLFNVLAGSVAPDGGTVHLGDRDITRLSMHQRARGGIARTFQLARELDSLTVLENLMVAGPDNPGESLWRVFTDRRAIRRAEDEAVDHALALLERTRLLRLANESAASLSGGQKKLLELCRALMMEAPIILLDEPAAGVNPALMDELVAFIIELRGEGRTFAIVEHNMDLIAALCDKVYVLADGRVLTEGTFAEVTADRRVQDAYLGVTL